MVKFSQEQKLEVVRQYLDGSDGVKRLARSIKTHPSVIQQWVKHYKAVGEKAFEKRYTSYSLQYKLDVL
ncbi:transposase, partial [Bacillus mobilis]